jgi:ATP-dependent Lon protease
MKESSSIAWSYVKKKLTGRDSDSGFDKKYFSENDVHLHIPAGAIPKDGPSAGVTMATALYSLLTGRQVKPRLAMTGELSLIGKVLPVGGIKEKLLAARRAGITTILIPKLSEKDLAEVPEYALKGLTIIPVSHVEEVFELALEPKGVAKTSKARRAGVLRSGAKPGLKKKSPARRGTVRRTGRGIAQGKVSGRGSSKEH